MADPKYIAVPDEDGTWSVVMADQEIPAVIDDVPQVGLSEEEATDIARVLNEMTHEDDG